MKELLHDDDVREEGREQGRKEGREEGREEGRKEGHEKGLADGIKSRDQSLIRKWLAKGKTINEIAEDLDVTEAYVEEIIQEFDILDKI